MTDQQRNLVKPIMPTEDEFKQLAARLGNDGAIHPKISVIIPVYKGLEETARCIYSVCENKQDVPFRLVVINDQSPDKTLVSLLEELSELGLIELHTNPKNLGFVGTVNYGMKLYLDSDVVLLNSDAEVYNNWLDRIYNFAYSDATVGTVTPLSNNAEICSYPVFVQDNNYELEIDGSTIDKIAARVNAGCAIDAPTGVGFCMFIKRVCLSKVGYFDEETFGRGYGEENDFCQRAIASGYRNSILADTYVRHYGSTSFGADKKELVKSATIAITKKHPAYSSDVAEYIALDQLKDLRAKIDIERIKLSRNGKLICLLSHTWEGGTERHVQDLKECLESANEASVLIVRPHVQDKNLLVVDDDRYPNIGPFHIDVNIDAFSLFIKNAGVDLLHVHHLIGGAYELPDFIRIACAQANVPYDFTVHDYFTVCPRIHLLDNYGQYCGEPVVSSCEICCKSDGYLQTLGGTSVWAWRDRNYRFLKHARKIWAPNADVQNRIQRYFTEIDIDVRVHPEPHLMKKRTVPTVNKNIRDRKKIALVGAIGPHKGSKLLVEVAKYAREYAPDLEFVVVGYSDRSEELLALGNVKVTGPYNDAQLEEYLISESPDLVWMSSICPETYSYTLSEVLTYSLTPVTFDFGAVSERIKSLNSGLILDLDLMLDSKKLCEELYSLCFAEVAIGDEFNPKIYKSWVKDYYSLV